MTEPGIVLCVSERPGQGGMDRSIEVEDGNEGYVYFKFGVSRCLSKINKYM